MAEQQKKRLEGAIGDMIEDMYKTHLRRMQSTMHRCAAHCCDDERGTLESVQNCIEKCALPLMNAQDYLQHELGQFQSRLQNCVKDCNHDVRSKLPTNPTDRDMSRSQHLFERCTGDCVDKHINLIPGLMRTIKQVLEKGDSKAAIRIEQRSQEA
ncbi:protein FAM136A [Scaptodrosophila lebanonensis]|uniref:Protein FAM136A n=1 Tax=Drosophila lebanonensis TaxID=7225 RepID=A0A6J2UFM2_DROLE|nr:protein FAM136A [Scaptodrosophila lebanonensis]